MTAEERETTIIFDDSDNVAKIFTASRKMINKLKSLATKFPEDFTIADEQEDSIVVICDKKLVSIRSPRNISEEHLEKIKKHF